MSKVITSEKNPPLKKSIRDKIELPTEFVMEKSAKIGQDTRKQFFVRFPSIIADAAKIKTTDKINFRVVVPLPLKNEKDIKLEMVLVKK